MTNLPAREVAVKRYIELGKKWAAGHKNRMIKVPATEYGLAALEELAAAGITLNVTLIFPSGNTSWARCGLRGAHAGRKGPRASRASTASSCRGWTYTREHVPGLTPPPRDWSESSTPSGCGS